MSKRHDLTSDDAIRLLCNAVQSLHHLAVEQEGYSPPCRDSGELVLQSALQYLARVTWRLYANCLNAMRNGRKREKRAGRMTSGDFTKLSRARGRGLFFGSGPPMRRPVVPRRLHQQGQRQAAGRSGSRRPSARGWRR